MVQNGNEEIRRPRALSSESPAIRRIVPRVLAALVYVAMSTGLLSGVTARAQVAEGPPEDAAADAGASGGSQEEMLRELWPQLTDYTTQLPGEESVVRIDPKRGGDVSFSIVGGVRREFLLRDQRVRVTCDSIVVDLPALGDRLRADRENEEPEGDGTAAGGPGQAVEGSREGPSLADLPFTFYAEGNVRLSIVGRKVTLGCDELWFDNREPLAVAHRARFDTTIAEVLSLVESQKRLELRGTSSVMGRLRKVGIPLTVVAETITTSDFADFLAEGAEVTHCDGCFPRVALKADTLEVLALEEDGEERVEMLARKERPGERDAAGARSFVLDLEGAGIAVEKTTILPLPLSRVDTRWFDQLPIRSVGFGSSSEFGAYGTIDWNLNFFLRLLPLEDVRFLRDLHRKSRLNFETSYFSRRGGGWGPHGIWGESPADWQPWQRTLENWNYYGEGRYFRVRDDGKDRSNFDREPPDPDRWWSSLYHRQAIPWLGSVDIEYSESSDQNFLNEYFEPIFKEEKVQENIVYWRRNIGDNLSLTSLYKYRSNSFDSVVERLPEGRLRLSEQPVLQTGLTTSLLAQGASFRSRPARPLGLSNERYLRGDIFNEWAYPIDWFDPWVWVRPFAFGRYTAYDDTVVGDGAGEDRGAFGAGISLGQSWSRRFDNGREGVLWDWFQVDSLKHVVSPEVTYRNLFANDLEPFEVPSVDEVDDVRLEESISLSLRQALFTRRRVLPESEAERGDREANLVPSRDPRRNVLLRQDEFYRYHLLDSEISFVTFPRRGRDNNGESLSLVVLDNTLNLSPYLSLRSWMSLDPNREFRGERVETSLSSEIIPNHLTLTFGDVFTRAQRSSGLDDTSFLYLLLSAYPSDKWRAQMFWSHDIANGRQSEISFTLGRIFRSFALLFEYSLDAGEDNSHSFTINVQPFDIYSPKSFNRARRW